MISPLGKVSEKARFESVAVLFGLVTVNASEGVPLMGMLEAPKLFTSTGGAITEIDAAAVLPVPPLLELTGLVMFMYWPAIVPVTVTLKTQLALAAIVAPEREIVLLPLTVKVPPHTLLVPLGMVSPAGKTSVNATPVSATVLPAGLARVKLKTLVAFTLMAVGLNALEIEGGNVPAVILMEAVALLPVVAMESPEPSSKAAVMLPVVLI